MENIFSVKDKVVVIFGGGGYLGKVICEYMSAYGAIVYSCDIQHNIEDNEKVHYRVVDATSKEKIEILRDEIISREKRVDVLVNTVTMKGNDFYLPFEEVSLEGWEIGLKGNLTIPFLTCQAFIPIMKEQKNGSIINISSHYGLVGNDQRIYEGSNLHEIYAKDSPDIERIYSHGVYNAAKGGLNNFSRYLAAYYGSNNIRVNTVSPGGLLHEKENETFLKKYGDKVPLGRKGKFEEIVGSIIYLASDASTYVTGHNLVVDGGYTCW